jgi:hypothetical protein
MSAPPRGPHGGGTTSGRSTPPPGSRGRGTGQGSASGQFRGRGGRGRGTPSTTNPKAEGLLQGLQTGNLNKRGDSSGVRAGRGEIIPSILRKRLEMFSRPSLGRHALHVANEAASIYYLLTQQRPFICPARSISIDTRSRHHGEPCKHSLGSIFDYHRSCESLSEGLHD